MTRDGLNKETRDNVKTITARKGKGQIYHDNRKEVNLDFVNPLFMSRSNGIVFREPSHQLTFKNNNVEYDGDLGLERGGLEDKKRKKG